MATINVKDAAGSTVALEKPLAAGQAAMVASRPVVVASDQSSIPVAATLGAETTKVIGVTRTADGSGNLLTSTTGALDINIKSGANVNGSATSTNSAPVVIASDQAAVAVKGSGSQASPAAGYASAVVAGDIAAAATDSGNPIKIGGVGKTANPTAVTDGQRANALFDKLGKQVVVGSVRDLKGSQFTTITSSTSETTVVTAVASTFLDVYGCVIENTSASACKVTFKDATAGTTRFEFTVPAGDTRGFMLPESGAFPQATVNNNWTATCGTSLASIVIAMLYVKNL